MSLHGDACTLLLLRGLLRIITCRYMAMLALYCCYLTFFRVITCHNTRSDPQLARAGPLFQREHPALRLPASPLVSVTTPAAPVGHRPGPELERTRLARVHRSDTNGSDTYATPCHEGGGGGTGAYDP